MPKTYFNNAIIGNSSMLGCISSKGELVRLFWPHIDYPQHIEKMSVGIFNAGTQNCTSWLESDSWLQKQQYIEDTNILETSFVNTELELEVRQTDYALPDRDVMIRSYEVGNIGENEIDCGLMLYSSNVSTNPHLSSSLFDFKLDSLIHYKYNYYISLSADLETWQFQLGNEAFRCAQASVLKGNDSIGMVQDGAASWKLGKLEKSGKRSVTLYICAAHTLKDVKKLTLEMKLASPQAEYQRTLGYWTDILKSARIIQTEEETVNVLYRRSILIFKLMADKNTGGLLASPEIDEEFTRCGRYAYCWGRDAAFITNALDKCGLSETVDKFYRWSVEVQDEDGFWHQRYHMDGNLAPSWGLQVDETGAVLWGILKHYEFTGSNGFLLDMWDCIKKGVTFLLSYIDADTGLPWLSFDLWEERLGEHAYSSAAVYGGIMAGVEIGRILGMPAKILEEWYECAERIKAAITKNFWKPESHRLIRSIRCKLNPWGEEYSHDKLLLKIDSKDNYREFTLEDWTIDISLLGLCVPFGAYEAGSLEMDSTAGIIEQALTSQVSGGLKRYENDGYMGGNPWVIATLWAALYHMEKNDYSKAKEYFDWAVKARTELGLLPEQVDRDTGKPVWVIPLTWSHAMFVLVLDKLVDAGIL